MRLSPGYWQQYALPHVVSKTGTGSVHPDRRYARPDWYALSRNDWSRRRCKGNADGIAAAFKKKGRPVIFAKRAGRNETMVAVDGRAGHPAKSPYEAAS